MWQELSVGAILREQNALPYAGWETSSLLAKDDVNNVGAGRAAKGAIPVIGITMLCPVRADSWTLVPRYSVASLLATAPQKRKSHSRFPFSFCCRQLRGGTIYPYIILCFLYKRFFVVVFVVVCMI